MVDTVRNLSELQTLLADNVAGDISAQDVRDFLLSVYPAYWRPATEGAADDYFIDDNESDWTALTVSGTGTWSYNYESRFGVMGRGAHATFGGMTASDFNAYMKPVSGFGNDDYVQGAVSVARMYTGGTSGFMGIALSDGVVAASNVAAILIGSNNNATNVISTYAGTMTGFGAAGIAQLTNDAAGMGPIHFRVTQTSANNFSAGYSLDGEDFTELDTFSRTMTPTHIGFVGFTTETSAKGIGRYIHSNAT